jgi:hypothetical protein
MEKAKLTIFTVVEGNMHDVHELSMENTMLWSARFFQFLFF